MKVGFVGVGAMGLPMARLLLSDHTVTVFDLDHVRVGELVADGAFAGKDAATTARGAEVVFVMVATPVQLEHALFGPDGVADGIARGAFIVLMSSVGVEVVTVAAERLRALGARVLDAPVTGGVVRAVTGELTILVGGSTSDLDGVRPLLAQMGGRVEHCGTRVGDGQAVKLVNQLLCSVHLVAAAESLSFARRLGLDPARVLATIETGAASSFMFSDRGPRMLAPDTPPVLSTIDIFVKDSGLVLAAAREAGANTPLTEIANQLFAEASAEGLGRNDDSSVIRLYEKKRTE